eukprot:11241103-Karenia_brevis.AAC.1
MRGRGAGDMYSDVVRGSMYFGGEDGGWCDTCMCMHSVAAHVLARMGKAPNDCVATSALGVDPATIL